MPKHASGSQREEQLWPVEYIVSARRTHESLLERCSDMTSPQFGSGWLYQVKWLNFPNSQNTWEPIDSFERCEDSDEVRDFWEEIGLDTMLTNVEDFEVEVRPQWIKQRKSLKKESPTRSTPADSPPTKPKKSRSTSRNRHYSAESPRKPARKIQKRGEAPKIKIPILTSSSSQLSVWNPSTRCETPPRPYPSTPTTPNSVFPAAPLSPPLTPEHEPVFTSAPSMSNELSNPQQIPTFAPNDDYTSPSPSSGYLDTIWLPANIDDGLDVEMADGVANPQDISVDQFSLDCLAEFLITASPDEISNYGGGS
ncbi:hypothetical protein C8F04DRAFT_1086910 [Mycena alexandri]|uniref:Chromo domain-containing protein n=1 Tax=Mycena alexandri TaxID=1745969 RepID=A0AAD6X4T1_9AGAR|nr:hypothetical protein C8F04DRAFT_1086910 [Mycena alexandri]